LDCGGQRSATPLGNGASQKIWSPHVWQKRRRRSRSAGAVQNAARGSGGTGRIQFPIGPPKRQLCNFTWTLTAVVGLALAAHLSFAGSTASPGREHGVISRKKVF
jgi:hypothetical protein